MNTNIPTPEELRLVKLCVSNDERRIIAKKHKKGMSYVGYIARGDRNHEGIWNDLMKVAEKNRKKLVAELA